MSTPTEPTPGFTPLAIVGIGCLFPRADGPGAFWGNIKHGVDGISPVPATHWNPADYFDPDPKRPDMTYAQRGGFLEPFDFNPLEFGIAPRDLEATDTSQLLGLVAAKRALQDAGIVFADQAAKGATGTSRPVDRNRVSVILGVTGTLELVVPLGARLGHPKWRRAMKDAGIPDEAAADAAQRIAESYVPWQENSFPGLLGNVVAGRIANRLDLGGTNCVVDAACASSLSAVHLAALELQAGRSDVVVTGGVDTFNDIFMYMCFSKTPALSPTGDARPFDGAGDGTILGEGLGIVVLKRLADAERDNDRIYAILKGLGSSSDGKGNAIYAPSAAGQKKALRTAYKLAGVTPDTIELVEAHGTGTKVGDAVEATALTEVYGAADRARPWCTLGSVKSQIGHTKAAAGSASLIKAALALYYKVLPPTLKVGRPVEPLASADSPFSVNAVMRPWLPQADHPRRAALSAFGFGGSNFHAVLEEHNPRKVEVDWDGSVEILPLSGATTAEITTTLAGLGATPDWASFARLGEQCRGSFTANAAVRLILVAQRGTSDLAKLIAGATAKLSESPSGSWSTPEGAYFGTGAAPGGLAVLFPGQGSQYLGMLRDLVCQFPEALDTLATAVRQAGIPLGDRIYPPTRYEAERTKADEQALKATDVAQPAIGAVSFGAWRVLSERFGLKADAFAGHSYGELPALAAAGRLTVDELFELSRLRGRLMADQRGDDPGAMLAVFAPAAEIEAVLSAAQLNVVIANRNAPKQNVLSGATPEIERAAQELSSRGIRATRLSVAAAFHSERVSDAAQPFRAALERIPFPPGQVPVFANTTAAPYPTEADATRDLLGAQLARPVAFVAEIEALAAAGVQTFLEVGPGTVLTRLTDQILGEGSTIAFGIDANSGKRPGMLDLASVLARLAARGHDVQFSAWEADSRCRPADAARPGLTVPISGANYVSPRQARPARPPLNVNGEIDSRGASSMAQPAPGQPNPHNPAGLSQALNLTQQTLATLQQLQEQTARLHKQFLESQDQAQRTLYQLVAQQQALLFPGATSIAPLGQAPAPVPAYAPPPPAPVNIAPAPAPAPVYAPPPPPPARITPPAPVPAPVPVARETPPVVQRTERVSSMAATRPAPAPEPAPAAGPSAIEKVLLDVVAEKTGYPASTLDLSMSLDADLGVDSIKRVEILSALQERLPEAPVVKSEHLGTLHTLRDVAAFLGTGSEPAPAAVEPEDDDIPMTIPTPILSGLPNVEDSGALDATGLNSLEEVEGMLVEVVAEKTGFPPETLSLDMTLDSDLGIDSIKRVEILSAVQEKLPTAPVVKSEHLGTLHTLRDIAKFLAGADSPSTTKVNISDLPQVKRPDESAIQAPTTRRVPVVPSGRVPALDPMVSELLTPKTEQLPTTRLSDDDVPAGAQTLRQTVVAPINLDRVDRSILQAVDLDLSIARPRLLIPEGSEIWVVGPEDTLTQETLTQLSSLNLRVKLYPWSDPDVVKPAGNPLGLVFIAPTKCPTTLNKLAFRWMQLAGPKLRQQARQSATLLASVARIDGAFGLADFSPTAVDPTSGGLAGLIKTARYEWPEVGCKAIDLNSSFADQQPAAAAIALADELLTAGPIEVGVSESHRCTLELARTVRRPVTTGPILGNKDVVLVTGGARGVTAEVALALAEAYQPTLILTGRTNLAATPEPEWLVGITDEGAMKKAIADRLGPSATPKAVGEQYSRVIAAREVASTIKRIEAVGARVAYFPVNVANGRQVADLLHKVQVKYGQVTGLIHGAGVLADKRIEDLASEQFDAVYSTKVDGLRTLLELLGHQDLKSIVLFSSTTARFGRTGQLAYACANEVLNKTAQVEARKRPHARVVAINWGPWDGGMVTPGLRKVFESEGVGLIPLTEGGLFAVQELTAAGRAVEVIALGKPGRAGKIGSGDVRSQTPPSAPALIQTGPPATSPPAAELVPAFERAVDVESHPILRSHVLDGRAVIPMALHMEWLAHAALHGNPGLVFHGFNDLRITHGIMVEDGGVANIRALAGKAVKFDKFFHVPVELRGRRRDGRDVIHSRTEVVLTGALPKPPAADEPPYVEPYPHPVDEVYHYFLFHGRELHGIERIEGLAETAFVGSAYPAPPPAEWYQNPLRSAWVADPLVLDASFQMMILWSFAQHGAGSLPCFAGRYRQYRRTFPTGPVRVVIRVTRDNGSFARADIDYLDSEGVVIAQVQDYECVIDRQLDQAFRRNQLAPRVKA